MSDVHRNNPEATDEEIEQLQAAALVFAPLPADYPTEVRRCRDCGRPFTCKRDRPSNTKWGQLCGGCLVYEI